MRYPLRHQGIARTATLLNEGWSRHGLKKALAGGQLVQVTRGWVARPNCDPILSLAAQHGLLVSCITQTERLGLWTPERGHHHFAVRRAGGARRPDGAKLHWRAPLVPRDPDELADPLINALDSVAHCLDLEGAVAVWDSALNKGLVDFTVLERIPFFGRSKEVLQHASPYSDSGLESYVMRRLAWLNIRIVPQAWVHGHRVDFLIGDRLVLQIDGGHHVGAQRDIDNRHDAELRLRGYEVIRVSYRQIMNDWPAVQLLIMTALAQQMHRVSSLALR